MRDFFVRWPSEAEERNHLNMLLNALEKLYAGKVTTEEVVLVHCDDMTLEGMLEGLAIKGNEVPIKKRKAHQGDHQFPPAAGFVKGQAEATKNLAAVAGTVIEVEQHNERSMTDEGWKPGNTACQDCGELYMKRTFNQRFCGKCSRKRNPKAYAYEERKAGQLGSDAGKAIGGHKLG